MDQPALGMFLGGMVTAGFLAGGLFFARFWVRSVLAAGVEPGAGVAGEPAGGQ